MPRKIGNVARSVLINAPLPQKTKTYTPIHHANILSAIDVALQGNGFTAVGESFKCTDQAQVATGVVLTDYGDDPDMKLVCAFVNSYNKSERFRAAIGVAIPSNNFFILGDVATMVRKHTGTADQETKDFIKGKIDNAKEYYDQLKVVKAAMQDFFISKNIMGQIIGELFFLDFLAADQVSFIKKQYVRPTIKITGEKDSLWNCYMFILGALKMAHPKSWLKNQVAIHQYLTTRFNLEEFDDEDGGPGFDPQGEDDEVLPVILPGYKDDYVDIQVKDVADEEGTNEESEVKEQEITTDSLGDEEPEVVIEEDILEKTEDTPDVVIEEGTEVPVVYFPVSEYEGLEEGDVFEEDGQQYTIVGTEDIAGASHFAAEPIQEITQEQTQPKTPAVEDPPVEEPVKEEPVTEPETPVEETKDEPEEEDPAIREALAQQIEEVFMERTEKFTYTLEGNQYNVLLDSGESVVFSYSHTKKMASEL